MVVISQSISSLQFTQFALMLVFDMMFLVILVLLMLPLGIWRQAAFAVMKRNFIGYFSNPTGYVFLCVFVLLTSFASFWPHEFFTTNLANFDQLNKFLPYIMLIFIPAITMSIWAEERRQGTDELLLTLPAKDFDIVIGKYFAAILVFTVSLLFSQLSNFAVLLAMTGGQIDNQLLFSTYLGYWFVGIAMIALGMVASFLTSNLTVGFIIGAALNAPLAFFSNADVIFSNSKWIQRLFDWSMLQRFEPFARGLISASSIIYFIGIVVIGVYLSMVLIGRRHWLGGRDGTSMFWHYLVRSILIVTIVISCVLIVQYSPLNRLRVDISESKINTLAPSTIVMLEQLASEEGEGVAPIKIEAYISNNLPGEYIKIKYDLVNLLREFDLLGGNRVEVILHQGIAPFSQDAILAEKKYGIRATRIRSQSRGALKEEDVVLGIAFSSGLERIVIPFIPFGMPMEYELMRSINTVSRSERKTIGIIETDSLVWGANIRQGDQDFTIPRLRILSELEKQYNVELVSASTPISLWINDENGNPISRRYDVLLSVQPSQSAAVEMKNLIDAIQSGQPTAIFEDPLPAPDNFRHVGGTFMPRVLVRGGTTPANIQDLWDALDLEIDRGGRVDPQFAASIGLPENRAVLFPYLVWQLESENPYQRNRQLNGKQQIIVHDANSGTDTRFLSTHPATQGVDELYFQYAGYIKPTVESSLTFVPLVTTGNSGRILVYDVVSPQSEAQRDSRRGAPTERYVIAAHIEGDEESDELPTPSDPIEKSKLNTNVIYVADIDTLSDFFVDKRNFPIENGVEYHYQNMSFVLNIIDALAKEDTYLGLRNRKIEHVTLKVVEATYEASLQRVYELDQELQIELQAKLTEAQNKIKQEIAPLENAVRREMRKKEAGKPYNATKLAAQQNLGQQLVREHQIKLENKTIEIENERRERKRQIDLTAELEIQEIQRKFKLAAVILPPIPPLLMGLFVFMRRRLREREGISKARRLK